jgi:hypothetical protein
MIPMNSDLKNATQRVCVGGGRDSPTDVINQKTFKLKKKIINILKYLYNN